MVVMLSRCDDRRIDCAQWEVTILRNELEYPGPVGLCDCLNLEVPIDNISEKADLGMHPDPSGQEKGDLSNHKRRNGQRTTVTMEE